MREVRMRLSLLLSLLLLVIVVVAETRLLFIASVSARVLSMFDAIDLNRDQLISLDEAREFFKSNLIEGTPEELWLVEDKNGDGFVSIEEFSGPKGGGGDDGDEVEEDEDEEEVDDDYEEDDNEDGYLYDEEEDDGGGGEEEDNIDIDESQQCAA